MAKPDTWNLFPFAVFVAIIDFGLACAANLPDHCTTDASAPAIQPVNSPVLFSVHIVNQDDAPVRYYAFRGLYPGAVLFKTKATDVKGNFREVSIFNDEDCAPSQRSQLLPAGQSLDMPAMIIEGLPVGTYTIQVRGGKSAKIAIKDDAELARKWDEELVAKIRKGDQFALHVGSILLLRKGARPTFVDALVRDLSSEEEQEAQRIANALSYAPELPPQSIPLIIKALRKHLDLIKKRGSAKTSILSSLAGMASTIGTDEALEPVLELAHTPETQSVAVYNLGGFKQEKAQKELRQFLKSKNDEFEFRAAQVLSNRKDPQALETLLVIAKDPKSRWRQFSFEALLNYPNDPRVEKAIKSGLDDANIQVCQFAEIALGKLHELDPNKKP